MKQVPFFSKLSFFLILPTLLFFLGCNADDKSKVSRSTPPPSNEVPTTASPTNAVSAADNKTASAPSISGKIILKGTPPPERELSLNADCGKLRTTILKTRLYVVAEGGALADVFVYIKEGLDGKTFAPPTKTILLDQVGCEYIPYVVGLQTKQKLLVRNSDPTMHNVHVLPKNSGNKESNKAQTSNSANLEYTFDTPEFFMTYKCEVHGWMYAYVNVVEHPFFAVSGKDGTFQIENVPEGKYLVEAYHRKAGKLTKEISVADGKSQPLEFTFEISASQ
ncbi:MAG: hypothetical protein ABIR24_00085 [Verrucomicrobiota bacterium]